MARIQLRPASEGSTTGLASPRASGDMFDRGIGAAAGQGLIAGAQALGQLNEKLERQAAEQEVTAVAASLAEARATWTVNMAEKAQAAGSSDPNFASKTMEEFDGYATKMGETVKTSAGKNAFVRGMASLRGSMYEKAGLYQVAMAADRAVVDFSKMVDFNRNSVRLDPTSYTAVLAEMTAAINDPSSSYARVPGNKRIELMALAEKQLAMSAVQGTIALSPELAQKQLQDGQWAKALDADAQHSLMGDAKQAIAAREVEAARKQREAKMAQEAAYDQTREVAIQKMAAGTLDTKFILNSNLPPTGEGSKEHFLNVLRARSKEGPVPERSDPKVFRDTFAKIRSGEITSEAQVEAIYAQSGGKLSWENTMQLRTEVQGKKTSAGQAEAQAKNQALQSLERSITKRDPLTGIADPKGEENWIGYNTWFLTEYEKQRKAGKSWQELLDPKKDGNLITPSRQYQRPMNEVINDIINPPKGNPIGNAAAAPKPVVDTARATRTAKDKNGQPVYEIGGKWLYGHGGEYKP